MPYYGMVLRMAKEKVSSEVLNLRIDEAMSQEIKRIAAQHGNPESEAARMLIDWCMEAHRAREAALLRRRYDAAPPQTRDGDPMELHQASLPAPRTGLRASGVP
jgi:hypothetical protein